MAQRSSTQRRRDAEENDVVPGGVSSGAINCGMQPQKYIIRRIRLNGQADYLTTYGGWSGNLELAQTFSTPGQAKSVLRKRDGEIIAKPQF